MAEMTAQEYWKEVREIAEEIIGESKEKGRSYEQMREYAQERLWEWIDGHEWIIYTWAYPYVLIHCSNEDAYFQEFGPVEKVESYSDIMGKMAFYAFYSDVAEELWKKIDEIDEAEYEEWAEDTGDEDEDED
jgi:hypothetical protein